MIRTVQARDESRPSSQLKSSSPLSGLPARADQTRESEPIMTKYWISAALLFALVIGCNSKPAEEDASDTGASTEELAGENEAVALSEATGVADDDVQLTGATLPADVSTTETDDVAAPELTPDQIRAAINAKLQEALQENDPARVVAILEDGRAQLPNDQDIALALLRFQLSEDIRAADGADREAVAARFLKTAALAEEVLGNEKADDPRYAQLQNIAALNKARALATQGKNDDAVAALRNAYAFGFEQYRNLSKDPFFASIVDSDAFKQVIEENANTIREKFRAAARDEFAKSEAIEFDFELPDLESNPVKLADFDGKVVIVDVWGTWCPPCRMEIPHFIDLKEKYKDDLEIVGITYEQTQDEQQAIKQVSEFVESMGVNYPCVIGDQATQEALNVTGFPTTLFIDRDGNVKLKIVGYHPYEKLEGYVAELIGDEKPSS